MSERVAMQMKYASAKRRNSLSASARGFTLIELMIVVAVVAILAAVAYPNYLEQVRKSRRAQAKADLVEYAQSAERFFTTNNSYEDFELPTLQSPREGGTAHYLLNPAGAFTDANTYTITATPQGSQAQDSCGTLTINQAGAKTSSTGNLADCW